MGIITSGSGLAGGVGYRNVGVFGPGLGAELGGQVSVRRYQHYYLYVGILGARPTTVTLAPADAKVESFFNDTVSKTPGSALYLDVRYRDFPRQTSYGVGLGSQQDDRSDYALRGTSVDGVWNWQIRPSTGVSVRGGVLDLDLARGRNDALMNLDERFASADMPGVLEQPRFLTVGLGLVYDTRSEPRLPADGAFVGMALRRVDAPDARDSRSPGRASTPARTGRRSATAV